MTATDKAARISRYAEAYLQEYGFEAVMVASRQKMALELLTRRAPEVVLEVGCGSDLLFRRAVAASLPVRRWIIVEPAAPFVAIAQAAAREYDHLSVIHGFLEESQDAVAAACGAAPDYVLASGLLTEIEHPAVLLGVIRGLLEPHSVMHVSVPNVMSFHRRLARAMRMIPSERTASERNVALEQFHFMDLADLTRLVEEAGFAVEDSGGYLLKPFTHKQLESISTLLTPELLDGLWQLGRELPEWASEIYVDARLPR